MNLVIPGNVDYSSSEIQQKYLDLQSIATSNEYFTPKILSWLSEFLRCANVNNFQINSIDSFYEELQYFLSLPHYRTFAQEVKFSENRTHITASRILVFSKSNLRSNFQRKMMTAYVKIYLFTPISIRLQSRYRLFILNNMLKFWTRPYEILSLLEFQFF